MTKQLKTPQQARIWLLENPWKEIKDKEGARYRWNPDECWYEWEMHGDDTWRPCHYSNDAPYTIVDESMDKSEWVRVFVSSFGSNEQALHHICQNAQQVRINYPDWSVAAQGSHYYNMDDLDFNEEMELLYALQIRATVEYLPKDGE